MRQHQFWFGAAIALAAGLALLPPVCAAEQAEKEPAITIAPAGRQQLDELITKNRGKVVLVDFWATWCAPCKEMFSKTVELHEKYRNRGLAVISVSFDEPEEKETALEFLKQKGARFSNLISEDGFDSTDTFAIDNGALPHYRLYDRSGKLVRKFVSGDPQHVFKDADLEEAVHALLTKSSK